MQKLTLQLPKKLFVFDVSETLDGTRDKDDGCGAVLISQPGDQTTFRVLNGGKRTAELLNEALQAGIKIRIATNNGFSEIDQPNERTRVFLQRYKINIPLEHFYAPGMRRSDGVEITDDKSRSMDMMRADIERETGVPLSKEEVLFFDDSRSNIEHAQQQGYTDAVRVRSADDLIQNLRTAIDNVKAAAVASNRRVTSDTRAVEPATSSLGNSHVMVDEETKLAREACQALVDSVKADLSTQQRAVTEMTRKITRLDMLEKHPTLIIWTLVNIITYQQYFDKKLIRVLIENYQLQKLFPLVPPPKPKNTSLFSSVSDFFDLPVLQYTITLAMHYLHLAFEKDPFYDNFLVRFESKTCTEKDFDFIRFLGLELKPFPEQLLMSEPCHTRSRILREKMYASAGLSKRQDFLPISDAERENSSLQAKRIFDLLAQECRYGKKIGFLYAANIKQALKLRVARNNLHPIPSVEGTGQAILVRELTSLINLAVKEGTLFPNQICIMPIATSLRGGEDIPGNQVDLDWVNDDLRAISSCINSGYCVYGIPADPIKRPGQYAIGGGNSKNWVNEKAIREFGNQSRNDYVQEQLRRLENKEPLDLLALDVVSGYQSVEL